VKLIREFESTQGVANRMSVRRLGDRAAGDNAGFSVEANGNSMKKRQSLFTVAEAAEILNMSEKTVRRFIRKRLLRSSKIGGLVRIAPADLDDLICDHRSQ
jgi:excisionase family DNA binding protein